MIFQLNKQLKSEKISKIKKKFWNWSCSRLNFTLILNIFGFNFAIKVFLVVDAYVLSFAFLYNTKQEKRNTKLMHQLPKTLL